MELDHEFTVPVPVDQAWSLLLDVERVASCMPGATLDSVDGEEYSGRMRVKLGAMTITYRGTARITSADESSRTVTLEASAKEARGSGTASATVVSHLHPVPGGGVTPDAPGGSGEGDTTRVTVRTKLNVTGRPAQFGRNILTEVGAKLVSRFADELAAELENQKSAPEPERTPGPATESAPEPTATEPAATEFSATKPAETERAKPKVPQQRQASPVESTSSEPTSPEPGAAEPVSVVTPIRPRREAEAIDLLEVAGPSVAKRAVPAVGAVLVLLLVVRFLVRRRRRRD